MRAIYRKIRHARYLYIKRNVEKVWGARYTLGARYLSKNMVLYILPINTFVLDQYTHCTLVISRKFIVDPHVPAVRV